MLQPNYRTENKAKFSPLPEDTYQVVIEDITNKERKSFNNPTETETVLNFQFLILDEGEFKGRKLWHEARPIIWSGGTSGKPSWLYRIYKATTGHEPETDELSGNEINSLIGHQLRLVVIQTPPKNGNIYNKIDGVMMVKVELSAPKLETKKPETTLNSLAKKTNDKQITDEDIPVINQDEEEEIDLADIPF